MIFPCKSSAKLKVNIIFQKFNYTLFLDIERDGANFSKDIQSSSNLSKVFKIEMFYIFHKRSYQNCKCDNF